MKSKIFLTELSCYKSAPDEKKNKIKPEQGYDLERLPTEGMRKEFTDFIYERAKQVSVLTMNSERFLYGPLCRFLENPKHHEDSFLNRDMERWLLQLKAWMMSEGLQTVKTKKNVYGKEGRENGEVYRYFRRVLRTIQPPDDRTEIEKDIWDLSKLGIELRRCPVKNVNSFNFTGIKTDDIREETKKAIFYQLHYYSVGTVRSQISVMKKFSEYLAKNFPEVHSSGEINREIIEKYLIHIKVEERKVEHVSSIIYALKDLLENIGKIYGYEHLSKLFLSTDIPPKVKPVFKVYSEAEIKRLNAGLTKLDVQITRMMVIHQLLGTRMSDTLTLERDCLYKIGAQDMIRINQPKTKTYVKPVSPELVLLIKKAIEYSEMKYGESKYIFVNEDNPQKPYQYITIQNKVMWLITKNDLRDDQGELFGFGSHMFRHYYGVKLVELHLDDWTISKLLGHKGVKSVQHYRRMSNQLLADETRKVREKMSEIILMNLDGWGEEYEQIRQNAGAK